MRICTHCVHHETVTKHVFMAPTICCNRRHLHDVTDGKEVYRIAAVERGTDREDNCGPEGKHFEPLKGFEAEVEAKDGAA